MKTFIFVLLVALPAWGITPPSVSLSPENLRLSLYRQIGPDKMEMIHLDSRRCVRSFTILKPTEGGEGKYEFPQSENYFTDVKLLKTQGAQIAFSCENNPGARKELWVGKIDLRTYRAKLFSTNEHETRQPQDWHVAFAEAKDSAITPLTRKFFLLTANDFHERLPLWARPGIAFRLLADRAWFPERRMAKKNIRLTAKLRDDIAVWVRTEGLDTYDILVTELDDELDRFGDLGIYLPNWLNEKFRQKFAARFSEMKGEDSWDFDFYALQPDWRKAAGKKQAPICIEALVRARTQPETSLPPEEADDWFGPSDPIAWEAIESLNSP